MRWWFGAVVIGWASATLAADVPHVVLVSVDGLAASYFDDPQAELPTLRQLARQGVRAMGMKTTFPSVTWPSHTSLVTGATAAQHGVIGNNAFDRRALAEVTFIGDPTLEKDQAIRCPTLYDVAFARGLKTASVIWPCCNGASTLHWVIPDSNKPALHAKYTTPGLVEELLQAGIDISKLGEWGWNKQHSQVRDDAYTATANYLLTKRSANLVLLHLITPDGVEHAYGPHTPEAYAAVKQADGHLKQIWDTLQSPPLAGKSALFVVSDHGFAKVEKLLRPNAVFREKGWIEVAADGKPTRRTVWCQAQGGSAFIYILDDSRRETLTNDVKAAVRGLEGVTRVIEPEEFRALGQATRDEFALAPDLILATGPGYSFDTGVTGEYTADSPNLKGTHGHLPSPPYMHATFVAAGARLKAGVKLDVIENIDVAPTIAKLMGIEFPSAQGRVLTEALAR